MVSLPRATRATSDVLKYLNSASGPVWGLQVAKDVGRPTGSVYPILARLEKLGVVVSEWEIDATRVGPRRRLYELSAEGLAAVEASIDAPSIFNPTEKITISRSGAQLG